MRPPSFGRLPAHGPNTFTLDGTPCRCRNTPGSTLVRTIFPQCPRKASSARLASNAGKSSSASPRSLQSAMSNGVAVMLDNSIHSGASPRGLYMTSLITICSARALTAIRAAHATCIPSNNRFIKTLPLRGQAGSSFRGNPIPAARVPPGFVPVFRDMKTVFGGNAPCPRIRCANSAATISGPPNALGRRRRSSWAVAAEAGR